MSNSIVVLLLLSSFQLVRVASFSLSISPEHVSKPKGPQSVSFTCSADAALTGCQFRWRDRYGSVGPLLELSQGSESQANSTHLNTVLTGYSYSGRGLRAGDCGVSLQVAGDTTWRVGCRVRSETGGWTYAWADLFAFDHNSFPTSLTPRETVVLPGGEARFLLKTQEALRLCQYFVPGMILNFSQGGQSKDSTGRHHYFGGGLVSGECGLALTNVSEADNGAVASIIIASAESKVDFRFMALIVARPPGAPTLSVTYTDAGVTATCEVHEGRPVANITWYLGDEIVRQDSLDDQPVDAQDEWRWPWMQGSILQRLTLKRQAEDNGKVLKCVASHVALPQPLEATEIISYTKPLSTTARASQLGNTSCPGDEVNELRVREARAAARTAELAEQQAMVTLEAAKATAKFNAEVSDKLAKLTIEREMVNLEAAKASAKSKAETLVMLENRAEEQAKVVLEAEKARAPKEDASTTVPPTPITTTLSAYKLH